MAALPWPSTLPACAETYSEKAEPVVIRTNVEEGPAKVRRRFTVRVVRSQVNMAMTIAQRNILDDFYSVDLDGGVGRFSFVHPWTRQPAEWRFIEAPDFASMGPMAVSVTMVWELMP